MNELTIFKKLGLQTTGNFNYIESVNAFIGNAYTSAAGNTYLNEIRLLEGLLIKEDVGHGYAHTFLNGIRIYDIKTKVLICEKLFHCYYYSESNVRLEVKEMLTDMILTASKRDNLKIDVSYVENYIENLIVKSFNSDQREMLNKQAFKYLNS